MPSPNPDDKPSDRLEILALLLPVIGLILCLLLYRGGQRPKQARELLLWSLLGIGQYIVIGALILIAAHYFERSLPKF